MFVIRRVFGRAVEVHSEDMIATYRFIRSKLFPKLLQAIHELI